MKTEELVRTLAAEGRPVARRAMVIRLAVALVAGMAVSSVVMIPWLGLRPDLPQAVGTTAYWAKFIYPLALALAAFWATERLARPDGRAKLQGLAMLAPFAIIAVLAAIQLALAPKAQHMPLWLGVSWSECPWRILALSLPILGAIIWAMRGMAPTRLVLAGLAAGLAAGAAGAWVYAFHCTETAMPFLALWYTLGVLATGALGALIARPLLRW